jgi:predicted phage terminase large subunit-like protein
MRVNPMTKEQIRGQIDGTLRAIAKNPYIPHVPTSKQLEFLCYDSFPEVMYGGAAGSGKSDALLMAALRYIDITNYRALLLRRNYGDLTLPGALMDRADTWLRGKARWIDKERSWIFPSGASLTFGHLEYDRQKYRYQGAEFQFIGFDELTQFKESQYTYLLSRLRRLKDVDIPLRMRSATNPGGAGHFWVKRRFVSKETRPPGCLFVPAKLDDNPYIDAVSYERMLSKLTALERLQLRHGRWDDMPPGGFIHRDWFEIVQSVPDDAGIIRKRGWDFAATDERDAEDPDFTAGAKLARTPYGILYIEDMKRARKSPSGVERLVRTTAEEDGKAVDIGIEREPGAAGKSLINSYSRFILPEYRVKEVSCAGGVWVRAKPWVAAAERGEVKLVAGQWNRDFLDECEVFDGTDAAHDDQIAAVCVGYDLILNDLSGAYVGGMLDVAPH